MSTIKLLDTLVLFEKKQQKRLTKFINSPYHNQYYNADQIAELLEYLLNPSVFSIKKSDLQIHFFPEKPFVENKKNAIDNLLSSLHQLVQSFIVQEELQDEIRQQKALALTSFYSKNNKEELIWPLISKYRKQWDKIEKKSFVDLNSRFKFEEEASRFQLMYKNNQKENNSEKALNFLDKSYLLKKTEIGFLKAYRENVLGQSKSPKPDFLLDYILQQYHLLTDIHTPLSDAYYWGIKVSKNIEEPELLKRFEKILSLNQEIIPLEDLRNLYTCYRSFIGIQYKRKGSAVLIPKLLLMYQEHLEKGYLEIEGKLHVSTLKLLANIGLKAESFAWVEQLLTNYPPKRLVGTRYPKDFHSLCTAELLFTQKKYEPAESQIIYRLFDDVNYSLNCDILLVKIYIETQSDLLESRIRALELKIRRAKLTTFDKKAYLNFVSVVRKADKYLFLKDEKKVKKLKETVQSDKPLIEREWLLGLLGTKN